MLQGCVEKRIHTRREWIHSARSAHDLTSTRPRRQHLACCLVAMARRSCQKTITQTRHNLLLLLRVRLCRLDLCRPSVADILTGIVALLLVVLCERLDQDGVALGLEANGGAGGEVHGVEFDERAPEFKAKSGVRVDVGEWREVLVVV